MGAARTVARSCLPRHPVAINPRHCRSPSHQPRIARLVADAHPSTHAGASRGLGPITSVRSLVESHMGCSHIFLTHGGYTNTPIHKRQRQIPVPARMQAPPLNPTRDLQVDRPRERLTCNRESTAGPSPRPSVNGHRFLPNYGHRISPPAAIFSPHWWPRISPPSGLVCRWWPRISPAARVRF
jgi:hypothetical protein